MTHQTARIISQFSKKGYNLQCIHVPKTIDNDLVYNDHTPGFDPAAKYVAITIFWNKF